MPCVYTHVAGHVLYCGRCGDGAVRDRRHVSVVLPCFLQSAAATRLPAHTHSPSRATATPPPHHPAPLTPPPTPTNTHPPRLRQPLNVCGDGGGPILGEGKPENQNAAAPYCTGLLQQAIDMNQDNTLAQVGGGGEGIRGGGGKMGGRGSGGEREGAA